MVGSEARFIHLRGGLTVPVEPLLLVFDLQERGFTLTPEDGETLVVQPYNKLTRTDCEQIRRWKRHVLALLSYEAPEVVQ